MTGRYRRYGNWEETWPARGSFSMEVYKSPHSPLEHPQLSCECCDRPCSGLSDRLERGHGLDTVYVAALQLRYSVLANDSAWTIEC